MDNMTWSDVTIALRYINYAEVSSWMQTRELMYSMMAPYLKNKSTTAKDLLKLPTDEDDKEELTTEIAQSDVDWYRNYVANYKKEHQKQ